MIQLFEGEKGGLRIIEAGALGAAFAVGGTEAAGYRLGVLRSSEAIVLSMAVPILVTIALILEYESSHEISPWRRRWVNDEFKKSVLMFSGVLLVAWGLAMLFASFTGGIQGAIIDSGAGMSFICSGIYTVRRFSW